MSNIIHRGFVCSVHGKPFSVTYKKSDKSGMYFIDKIERIREASSHTEDPIHNTKKATSETMDFSKIGFVGWECPWCGDIGEEKSCFDCGECGLICGGSFNRQPKLIQKLKRFKCSGCDITLRLSGNHIEKLTVNRASNNNQKRIGQRRKTVSSAEAQSQSLSAPKQLDKRFLLEKF